MRRKGKMWVSFVKGMDMQGQNFSRPKSTRYSQFRSTGGRKMSYFFGLNTASLQIEAMRYFPSVLMIYSYKIPGMWLDSQAKPLLQYRHIQGKHNRYGMWKPRDHYLRNTRGTKWQVSSLTYACPSSSSLNVITRCKHAAVRTDKEWLR
jgi:hypothetical protein